MTQKRIKFNKILSLTLVFTGFVCGSIISFAANGGITGDLETKEPEVFVIDSGDEYQGYFQIKGCPDDGTLDVCSQLKNTVDVSSGEQVKFNIFLTTTGEKFDAAAAVIKYNADDFEYVDEQINLINDDVTEITKEIGLKDGTSMMRRSVNQLIVSGDPMQLNRSEDGLFYTFILKAKKDNPGSTVSFSTGENKLGIHFVDKGGSVNSINQSLSPATSVSFTAGEDPDPSPSADKTNILLKMKYEAVPANGSDHCGDDFCNLLPEHRERAAGVWFVNKGGDTKFSKEVVLRYDEGFKGYKKQFSFSTDPSDSSYLPGGDYRIFIKDLTHQTVMYCKENQQFDDECSDSDYFTIEEKGNYTFNFHAEDQTSQILEFGDILLNPDNPGVNVADYSALKDCLNSKKGDGKYFTSSGNNGCWRADGDFNGVVDSTDKYLIQKTLMRRN
jgi:hypothetical protein